MENVAEDGAGGDVGHVYVLRDPRTNAVRYIGYTVNPVGRLRGHTGGKVARLASSPRSRWIRELSDLSMVPTLEVLEQVPLGDPADREGHWIRWHAARGAYLFNVGKRSGRRKPWTPPKPKRRVERPTTGAHRRDRHEKLARHDRAADRIIDDIINRRAARTVRNAGT